MTKETRLPATLIFFAAMLLTLLAAFRLEGGRQKLLVLVGVATQFCAYFWYSLTFIPFGRKIFKACCKSCCAKCFDEEEK